VERNGATFQRYSTLINLTKFPRTKGKYVGSKLDLLSH
jgi:hypothetical protein